MTAQQALRDRAVRHAIYLQRYSGSVVNRIVALLNRTDADLVAQIERRLGRVVDAGFDTGPDTTRRLQALLTELRELNRAAYEVVGRELGDELRIFSAYEAQWQASLLQSVMPAGVATVAPAARTVAAAAIARPFQGRLLREWVQGMEASRAARLRDAIRIGMVEGQTINQIVQRIRGTRAAGWADGLLEIDRRGAQALVRTAVSHVSNVAREMVAEDNDDIVQGVQWVATLDARTTPICQARDGKTFPIGKGPRPPAHIACRSTTVPVLNDEFAFLSEGRTRASKDGQVAATETYQSWLKRQPASFQDEVLGPARGALFRRGGVTLDRFVNRAGDELTLAQLRQREPAAIAKVEPKLSRSALRQFADDDAINYVQTFGARDGVEYAAAYDHAGKQGLRKRGSHSSVDFTPAEIAGMRDGYLVHNHPNGSSLSLPDLAFMSEHGLREIVAVPTVGPGAYRARPVMSRDRVVRAHAAADTYSRAAILPEARSGRLTWEQANLVHWHLVNSALNEVGVVAYSVVGTPAGLEEAIRLFGRKRFHDMVKAFTWTP